MLFTLNTSYSSAHQNRFISLGGCHQFQMKPAYDVEILYLSPLMITRKTTSDLHLRGHSIDEKFHTPNHFVGVLVNSQASIDPYFALHWLAVTTSKMTLPQSSKLSE